MRLRIRMLLIFIVSLFSKKKTSILEITSLPMYVLPNDVDVKYMTNDRYLSIMDLGRLQFLFSFFSLKDLIRKKWIPVATQVHIQYRLPLKIFQKYNIHTAVIWWDNRRFYILQKFETHGRIVASAIVSASLMSKKGLVSPRELLSALNQTVEPPEKPELVKQFQGIQPSHKM